MASVNKAIVVGNLGRDPETRYMPNGEAVTNITVATTENWKDKNTGEKKELTEWHRVTFYRKLAEIAGQYLKKGSQVYVEGRLQTRKWIDKDGIEKYSTEIIADIMQMLGNRQSINTTTTSTISDNSNYNNDAITPHQNSHAKTTKTSSSATAHPMSNIDDDIPF